MVQYKYKEGSGGSRMAELEGSLGNSDEDKGFSPWLEIGSIWVGSPPFLVP